MIIQADEYEKQQNVVLQDFFDSTANYFTQPEVIQNYYLLTILFYLLIHRYLAGLMN